MKPVKNIILLALVSSLSLVVYAKDKTTDVYQAPDFKYDIKANSKVVVQEESWKQDLSYKVIDGSESDRQIASEEENEGVSRDPSSVEKEERRYIDEPRLPYWKLDY